ncbi:hypothetical protein DSO57_1009466 [Entomophthora muscae]|uniref:Uncharacterized protein n=1 Tax=Entomophthora muscae TaxID=34485 RepID=A0ACC2UGI6_9FUNG|nr:hypothetical protein DSO57_1009466 [Entomophthora muscae]
MYPVCGDKDPLVTLIPVSWVISSSSPLPTPVDSPPTQVAGLCSLAPSQQYILLVLLGTLLHDMLLDQYSSPCSVALLFKLTP